jgi:hypothetical protein
MVFGIFGLEFLKILFMGGERIVYWCTVSFGSFLENLDIDEFN